MIIAGILFIVSLLVIEIERFRGKEKVSLSSNEVKYVTSISYQDQGNENIQKLNDGDYQVKKTSKYYAFIEKNKLFVFSNDGRYMWSWEEMSEKINVETIGDLDGDGYEELKKGKALTSLDRAKNFVFEMKKLMK